MALNWNEIKSRAIRFSKEWENETREEAEAKSFWDDFFDIFGISRKRVAIFEMKVTKENRKDGYIDLLWKGHLLIEHKSSGKNLDRAYKQATEYFPGLKEYELPKYILVCNFQHFRLYDLEENIQVNFDLIDLVKNVKHFAFIAGYQKRVYKEEDPVNIKAAELMGSLHDKLLEVGYKGHQLEVYLVRLLFCLFADDTSIFTTGIFEEYIAQRTNEDGSDLAAHLSQIFEILNTPPENRLKNIEENLAAFRYINGKLFEESLPMASFNSKMRNILLKSCALDWGKISPAIFGSLFQSVKNKEARREMGEHYTSEKNILKLIKSLFLDELWREFESVKDNRNKLLKFHDKISSLRFLDPACGCGNFLVITYREIRLLEIEIIKALQKGQMVTDISNLINVDVDQFYGIETEEFPAQIAQVAMWLMDHQMNLKMMEIFGNYYERLPLRKSATIINRNALTTDWQSLLNPVNTFDVVAKHANIYEVEEPPEEYKTVNIKTETYTVYKGKLPPPQIQIRFNYIFGNPPFIGKQHQKAEQKSDMELIWRGVNGAGVLDYVSCWYLKAAQYLNSYSQQTDEDNEDETKVAFVSTNSIAQGEQVGILWNELFNKHKIKIHFAHRTFKWSNEARGKAGVYVVIVGFSNCDSSEKYIYEYETVKSEPHVRKVKNINPYLIEAGDFVILKRRKPICNVPEISFGSMPNDGGHFLFTDAEKKEFLKIEPEAKKFIKPLLSAKEFLNGEKRWCLWLTEIEPSELRQLPETSNRVKLVKELRNNSNREATKKLASFPTLFGENRQPDHDYILIPRVTSENRKYIPLGFFNKNFIVSDTCLFVPNGKLFHFGVMMSEMHMAWVNYVCGRLESRFRYSNEIVYNNYPWPENPTEKQIMAIEKAAQKVLDVRKEYEGSSLSDLYDPIAMPPKLVKAHQELDKAVDLSYRSNPFPGETKRIEFLFDLYEKYTAGMFVGIEKKKKNYRS